ncbi:ATPase [Candidatus Wirthbacteria bacterium CG2_30_54_11]|uniref:ATPase n=1 Tax=Candidatus Wirthbacteria bacterium CG2_30_54_11 TaxID=1817892 RepID=A0A1J5IRV4_9BACT|nr:MAG: ATPase [Candidatus Wirthbacteria bacterium CG2_30_54_11]
MATESRFLQKIPESYFLFGPRGTGKTTWLKQEYPEALYLDLLSPEIYRSFVTHPERLREMVKGERSAVVIIDEIQKVPALLDVIHQLVEEDKTTQYILTGSSARKLKRSGVDLLSGRLLWRSMYPFMAAELGDSFDLEAALSTGLIPLVQDSTDPLSRLHAYIDLYVREEVQYEGLVRKLDDFLRFIEAVSFSHASLLNVTEVAREAQAQRKTVAGYIQILEDILIAYQITPFRKKAKRNTVSHSKFYFFDTGVFRILRPHGPLDRPEEITGLALEGLVAQHLRSWIGYGQQDTALHFWRSTRGVEVDFVLYGQNTFAAVEVKSSTKIRPSDLNGLRAFREDYPQAQLVFLYRGEQRLLIDGILCIPCERFLRDLRPGLPFVA